MLLKPCMHRHAYEGGSSSDECSTASVDLLAHLSAFKTSCATFFRAVDMFTCHVRSDVSCPPNMLKFANATFNERDSDLL